MEEILNQRKEQEHHQRSSQVTSEIEIKEITLFVVLKVHSFQALEV